MSAFSRALRSLTKAIPRCTSAILRCSMASCRCSSASRCCWSAYASCSSAIRCCSSAYSLCRSASRRALSDFTTSTASTSALRMASVCFRNANTSASSATRVREPRINATIRAVLSLRFCRSSLMRCSVSHSFLEYSRNIIVRSNAGLYLRPQTMPGLYFFCQFSASCRSGGRHSPALPTWYIAAASESRI